MKQDRAEDLAEHLARVTEALMQQRHDALEISNSASYFLISRCEMIGVNPFLAFLFMHDLCAKNIDKYLSNAMAAAEREAGIGPIPDDLKADIEAITEHMKKLIFSGLEAREVDMDHIRREAP